MTLFDRKLEVTESFARPTTFAAAGDSVAAVLPFVGSQHRVSLGSRLGRAVARMAEAVLVWHERARARRALMQMSDHMLRDIGISRADAAGEVGKPFWRA